MRILKIRKMHVKKIKKLKKNVESGKLKNIVKELER